MKSLCIIPVFNEETKLNKLIRGIKKNSLRSYSLKYLFVNNGSTDNSLNIIKKNKLNYISFNKNYGVGYALIKGYLYAKKYKFKIVIHLAGNGKMNPDQIPIFLKEIIKNNYDFVSGSRFLKKNSHKQNPLYRIIMIKIFSLFLSLITQKKITDCSCGFRAFKIGIFKNFKSNFFRKNLFTYGYEYFSYGKVINSKKIMSKEIPVTMNYPSKKNYTKIKPFVDWYIMAKFWILGYYDNKNI
jgi:dolichol-phosphate mannosyltransferase